MSTHIRIALAGFTGLAALVAAGLMLTQPTLGASRAAEPWQLLTPVAQSTAPVAQEVVGTNSEAPPVQAPTIAAPTVTDVAVKPPHDHPQPPGKPPTAADDFVAVPPVCGEQFATGRWTDESPGTTGTFTSLTADTSGSCESVQVGFDGAAPPVEVMRIPYLNYTMIRFDTDQLPMAPTPKALMADGQMIAGVVAFQDNISPALLVQHPSGVKVAARTVVHSNTLTIEFRAAQDSDLTHDGAFGGEPYDFGFDGSPQDGLVVVLATELEASGEIGVLGYARAPEATLVVRVWDGPVLVNETAIVTEGPAYSFGRFWHTLQVPDGTYTVEVGWDSPSGDPDLDVWYSTEVSIIGNP